MAYTVLCPTCGLEEAVEELEAVLDLQEAHREEHGDDHVFEFSLVGRTR